MERKNHSGIMDSNVERQDITLMRIGTTIVTGISGLLIGCVYMLYHCGIILDEKQKKIDKFQSYFETLNLLMECREKQYDWYEVLSRNNINSIAIYGMGKLGRHLKYELEQSNVVVSYIIDKAEIATDMGQIRQYNLNEHLPVVDAVIVTPVHEYEKIKGEILKNNKKLRVVSLNTILSWSR